MPEVFHPVHSALLRDGARLVRSAADVDGELRALAPEMEARNAGT